MSNKINNNAWYYYCPTNTKTYHTINPGFTNTTGGVSTSTISSGVNFQYSIDDSWAGTGPNLTTIIAENSFDYYYYIFDGDNWVKKRVDPFIAKWRKFCYEKGLK